MWSCPAESVLPRVDKTSKSVVSYDREHHLEAKVKIAGRYRQVLRRAQVDLHVSTDNFGCPALTKR